MPKVQSLLYGKKLGHWYFYFYSEYSKLELHDIITISPTPDDERADILFVGVCVWGKPDDGPTDLEATVSESLI